MSPMFKVNGILSYKKSIGSKGDKSVTLGTFKEGDLETVLENTPIPMRNNTWNTK